MKVKQVYTILNDLCNEILGRPVLVGSDGNTYYKASDVPSGVTTTPSYMVAEDLSNVVDIGRTIFDATSVDNYVKTLINHIGRVIFVDRAYSPVVPSVIKESWEYGSILEKIDCDMPESVANPKWELKNKTRYDQDTFKSPDGVRAKFFNDAITYQIDMSFTEDQVKESFSNATQLNSFFSMVQTKIKNRLNIDYANLTRATINAFIAATLYRDYNSAYSDSTHKFTFGDNSYVRSVNLLAKYRDEGFDAEKKLTPETALKNLDFIKFASYTIARYTSYVRDMSVLFNMGGKERFTPTDLQHLVLHADFKKAADVYLQSDTFHNEFVTLPKSEEINFWQGTGSDYGIDSTGRIHVTCKVSTDGTTYESKEIDTDGAIILGCLFDNDALGINNEKNKVTSHYNANGDFINNFYKSFARYFNDHDENFVVFFVA